MSNEHVQRGLCLAGFSTQRSNIKAAHGPGKLGIAETGGGVLIIDSEYAGFIAVEDHRFTVFSGGRSHQFVSARQYKDAGNEADEFSVRVVCGDPESRVYHETSDGFLSKDQTVNFLQLFPRQRGAKITVVLPDYTECLQ